jgi:hypothetical protein
MRSFSKLVSALSILVSWTDCFETLTFLWEPRKTHKLPQRYDFSSSSDSDVETSNLSEHRLNEYEMFLNGFYYFFLLQDPFIRNYLNLRYSPTMHQQEDILSDLKFFQDNCMLSWVQVMIKLEVFQSTAQFQWSNALSFCI